VVDIEPPKEEPSSTSDADDSNSSCINSSENVKIMGILKENDKKEEITSV